MSGGLIGRNIGGATVIQSYATGGCQRHGQRRTGTAMAGGLIGSHASTGTVAQTYAAGAVSAISPRTPQQPAA